MKIAEFLLIISVAISPSAYACADVFALSVYDSDIEREFDIALFLAVTSDAIAESVYDSDVEIA